LPTVFNKVDSSELATQSKVSIIDTSAHSVNLVDTHITADT